MAVNPLPAVAYPSRDADRVSVALVVDRQHTKVQVLRVLDQSDVNCTFDFESIERLLDHGAPGEVDAIILCCGGTRTEVIDAFKRTRAVFPEMPIVGLWPDGQRREDHRALKAGVDGLLEEDQIATALLPTIHAVCAGLVCLPPRLPATLQPEALSNREKQILGMLIMGFTNAEIGKRLYLAESTVKSHLSSAYLKLGVRSRKDAAALILDPEEGLGTGILAIQGG